MFNLFYKHTTVNHPHGTGACNTTCFRGYMCTIKYQVNEELNGCLKDDRSLTVSVLTTASATAPTSHLPLVTTTSHLPLVTTTSYHLPLVTTTTNTPVHIPRYPKTTTPTRDYETDYSDTVSKDVVSQPIEASGGNMTSRVAGIFLGLSGAIILSVILGIVVWKYRQRRHRDQEFLLTDSVFRYDGYSQLDDF